MSGSCQRPAGPGNAEGGSAWTRLPVRAAAGNNPARRSSVPRYGIALTAGHGTGESRGIEVTSK